MPTGLNLNRIKVILNVPKLGGRNTDPPPFFVFLNYLLCTDFSDALLTKFLIQQHRGVSYLKEHDIFMSTTGHCLEFKRI